MKEQIEKLIDTHGVVNVLHAISEICGEKADHIRSSYNDKVLAKAWDANAGIINTAAGRIHV